MEITFAWRSELTDIELDLLDSGAFGVSDIPVKREVFAGVPVSFHAPNDAADLARAIKSLLDNEDEGWHMVDGFAPKITLYQPETIAAKICAVYEGLKTG